MKGGDCMILMNSSGVRPKIGSQTQNQLSRKSAHYSNLSSYCPIHLKLFQVAVAVDVLQKKVVVFVCPQLYQSISIDLLPTRSLSNCVPKGTNFRLLSAFRSNLIGRKVSRYHKSSSNALLQFHNNGFAIIILRPTG